MNNTGSSSQTGKTMDSVEYFFIFMNNIHISEMYKMLPEDISGVRNLDKLLVSSLCLPQLLKKFL